MTIMMRAAEKPQPRFHRIDGRDYVRVSTVLATIANPGIVDWKLRVGADEAARISRDATEHGTRLHRCLELSWTGQGEPVPDDLAPWVNEIATWAAEHVTSVVAMERRVVSRSHGYSGTADAVLEMRDGSFCVADFKTSKYDPRFPIDPNFFLQAAAYRLALAEEGVVCQRRIILQMPRNMPGKLIVHELDEHRADTEAWLNLLAVYRYLERHR